MLSYLPHNSILDTVMATLQVWHSLFSIDQGIPQQTLQHLPLLTFELLSTHLNMSQWAEKGISSLQGLYLDDHFRTFQDLCESFSLDFYKYLRISLRFGGVTTH